MSRTRTRLTAGAVAAALAIPLTGVVGTAPASAKPLKDRNAIGLVDGVRLVQFDVRRPGKATRVHRVGGLTGGDTELVGIDRRVQDNRLYGVGDRGGVYRIGPHGTARQVNRLTVALEGREFGVDFNPAADRLRIVSNTGQNLRHDLTGTQSPATATDTPLNYPATSTAPAIAPATGVTAAAYTNNDRRTDTGTALYVIDTVRDQLAAQSPANAGILQANGTIGRNALLNASLDIGKGNRGYAVLRTGSGPVLYRVDLLRGDTSRVGRFPRGMQVSDLALSIR